MLFIIPALLIAFIYKTNLKTFFTNKQSYKMLLVSLGIFLLVLVPFFAREAILIPEGLSTIGSRTATRINYFTAQNIDLPGIATAYDYEFQNELFPEKRNLIINRYQVSYFQKAATLFSALFLHWILIPFILLSIFKRKQWSFKNHELLSLLFVITTIAVFTFQGLLPRYLLPASVFLFIFAARGIFTLPRKFVVPALVLVLLVIGAQTGHFLFKISQNDHIQSMQHDYDGTARYLLENTPGNFTIITTRVYQIAFNVMMQDTERRVYVEMAPFKKDRLLSMIQGDFTTPELLHGKAIPYSTKRPPVAYVVVHERLETGALRETADYNLVDTLNAHPRASLVRVIDSPFPNSRTWIYSIQRIHEE
jgi:hypothetical protein